MSTFMGASLRRKLAAIAVAIICTASMHVAALAQASAPQPAPLNPKADAAAATSLIFLGTNGGPPPNMYRSEPSTLLLVHGKPYLIDVGAGTFHSLYAAGYFPNQVRSIFISHNHLDHNAGLLAVLSEAWILGNVEFAGANYKSDPTTTVYGPTGTQTVVDGVLQSLSVSARIFNSGLTGAGNFVMPQDIFKAHEINANSLFFDDGTVKVTAVENTHFHFIEGSEAAQQGDKSYAYRFDTPEASVVYTGDTGPSDAVTELARGADVLVTEVLDLAQLKKQYEAMNLTDEARATLIQHMLQDHLAPEVVGQMAQEAGVKTVVLYHIVPAEQATRWPLDTTEITAGVHKYFDGQVLVSQDHMRLDYFDVGRR